jgi:hypothetical protein
MKIVKTLDAWNPPREGSTIFLEHIGPRFIEKTIEKIGGGDVTHVAITLRKDTELMVYEATPPKVRCITWYEYVNRIIPTWEKQRWTKRQGGTNPFYLEPESDLDLDILQDMREVAENKIGVKYSLVAHYLWNGKGIHCSSYVGLIWYEAYMTWNYLRNRESPHTLLTSMKQFPL